MVLVMAMVMTMAIVMVMRAVMVKGLSIKYVTLEGEGVRDGVTVCDRGSGIESM